MKINWNTLDSLYILYVYIDQKVNTYTQLKQHISPFFALGRHKNIGSNTDSFVERFFH